MRFFSPSQSELVRQLLVVAQHTGVTPYVVGGVVRDLLRESAQPPIDIDLVVEEDPSDFYASAAQVLGGELRVYPEFMTAKIHHLGKSLALTEIDIARARKEEYLRPAALPLVTPCSLAEDLKRRDFSVNALAVPLEGLYRLLVGEELNSDSSIQELRPLVVDLVGGLEDLDKGELRVLHPRSFSDDPTRIFRAARYKVHLRAQLSRSTQAQLQEVLAQGVLKLVEPYRLLAEYRKVLRHPCFGEMLLCLEQWGVLQQWLELNPAIAKSFAMAAQRFQIYLDGLRFDPLQIERVLWGILSVFAGFDQSQLRHIGISGSCAIASCRAGKAAQLGKELEEDLIVVETLKLILGSEAVEKRALKNWRELIKAE